MPKSAKEEKKEPTEKPPKKSPTAFQLWSKDNRDTVKGSGATSFGDIQKALAEKWKKGVDASDKEPFEKKAAQLKITYQKDLAKWKDANPGVAVRKAKGEKAAAKETKKKRKKDPNAPKKALTAYVIFANEHREATKAANPEATFGTMGKLLAAKWNALEEKDKEPYNKKAAVLKLKYEEDVAAYHKAGGGSSPLDSKKDTKKRDTKKEKKEVKKETKKEKESSEEESEKSASAASEEESDEESS